MTEVSIRSEDRSDQVLTIGRPTERGDGIYYVQIRLEAAGLSCTGQAIMSGDDGIRRFFAELAADWRGWSGTRTWHTLEGELSIAATHTGRRIELACTLRRDFDHDAWQVSLVMSLPPGEPLTRLAGDIDQIFNDV